MPTPIKSDTQFIAGLTKAQRAYFMQRLANQQERLQSAILHLCNGLSEINVVSSDVHGLVLEERSKA